jgi:hypothetical protein
VARSAFRFSLDAVLACTPMTALVSGVGLGAAGYLAPAPALGAGGALVAAAGLYAERMQARSLRRRRRAERVRNRHEVTELRRTIAQLRLDVDAFQRALSDTEAAIAAQPVPAPTEKASSPRRTEPAVLEAARPAGEPTRPAGERPRPRHVAPAVVRVPAPVSEVAPDAGAGRPAVATVAIAQGWVQTAERDAESSPLPLQHAGPFVSRAGAGAGAGAEMAPPRRAFDTAGIPVLDPVPADRLRVTTVSG